MGIKPFLIASSLSAVLAQRLLQTLCPHCKEPYEPTERELTVAGIERREGVTFYRPVGCEKCHHRGFSGLTAVSELLIVTDEIGQLIIDRADSTTIKKLAVEQGMIPLRQDAIEKVYQGITSISEMVKAINSEVES
jgi:type II secretory ATPase GspE/PulE/Tfp pilus assembly ATPase PilB-like protein